MTRAAAIELIQRKLGGGVVADDTTLTSGLINLLLDPALAVAAKQNYKENFQIEGIGFVNNSFYSTFKGIAITRDEKYLWKLALPTIPLGIGKTEGIETLKFQDSDNNVSLPAVFISSNQASFFQSMRAIPNKILCKPEGGYVYAISEILLSQYTATITMISGGDATDLTSTLNIPSDYLPIMIEWIKVQLLEQKAIKPDGANDGIDVA